jgi:hypothetical protein
LASSPNRQGKTPTRKRDRSNLRGRLQRKPTRRQDRSNRRGRRQRKPTRRQVDRTAAGPRAPTPPSTGPRQPAYARRTRYLFLRPQDDGSLVAVSVLKGWEIPLSDEQVRALRAGRSLPRMRDDRVIHFNSGSEKPWVHALRLECLQCGELRERSAGVNGRRPESADASGYLGWALSEELSELTRRALRERRCR